MKKGTGLGLALLLLAAVAGCGGSKNSATSQETSAVSGSDTESSQKAADGTENADSDNMTAADNIYIENINVSGMNEAEITAAVQQKMQELAASTIILSAGGTSTAVSAQDFGLSYTNTDVIRQALETGQRGNALKRFEAAYQKEEDGPLVLELKFDVNEDQIRQVLSAQSAVLQKPAVNVSLVRNADGSFTSSNGEDGWAVDTDAAVQTIHDFFTGSWRGGRATITLATTPVAAKGGGDQIALVKDVLAQSQTSYADSTDVRKQNIQVGVSLINGSVIYPGEEFSVEAATQPYTAENGYAPAPSYEMGSIVDTYGGGLCQVSTTLYLAVLNAELEVTERSSHSMIVNYVEPSMDAAVAEGVKDLKFVNNTDAPIYIEGIADGGVLSFNIYGHETREAGRTLAFQSETLKTTAITDAFDIDPELDWGQTRGQSGHLGCEARLWKTVSLNGVEQSREQVNDSEYNMAPNTVFYGTKGASDEAVSELKAAVQAADTVEDAATINAVVAKYAGQITPAQ